MATPDIVTDGLLLHYHAGNRGDNLTKWQDISGNGLNGTLKQFAYNESSGWADNGLVFDGIDDYVLVTENGIGTFNNQEFTLEAWVTPQYPARHILFSYDYSVGAPYYCTQLRIGLNGADDYWVFFYNNFGGTVRSFGTPLSRYVTTGEPIHIVATCKSGEQKIYINNVLRGQNTFSGTIGHIANNVYIGRSMEASRFFGEYHLFRYYAKTLTADEVAQNYAAGITWPIDEISHRKYSTSHIAPTLCSTNNTGIGYKKKIFGMKPISASGTRATYTKRKSTTKMSTVIAKTTTLGRSSRTNVSQLLPLGSSCKKLGYDKRISHNFLSSITSINRFLPLPLSTSLHLQAVSKIVEHKTTVGVLGVPIIGNTIKLRVDFYDLFTSEPSDPEGITFTIYDSSRTPLFPPISIGDTHKVAIGTYEYPYTIPSGHQSLTYEFSANATGLPVVARGLILCNWR